MAIVGRDETPSHLTDELRKCIRCSFDECSGNDDEFPLTVDVASGFVRAIVEYGVDLSNECILDVGCGKGRFAHVLLHELPGSSIVGIDVSGGMLKYVSEHIRKCVGSMTALPFRDQRFDLVYAVESLEHAVEISLAVSEMCRVLRVGGRLVIIDKNAEQAGRLKTPFWEKWFHREEIERLLSRECSTVSSRFVSYRSGVEPDGLFIVWMATK